MEDRLAVLRAGELEVDEATGLEGLEGPGLLRFVAVFELLEGDGLELDGRELGVVREGWELVWSELGVDLLVRHNVGWLFVARFKDGEWRIE